MERLIIKAEGAGDRAHPLSEDIVLVGRGDDCGLQLALHEISRFHARIERQADGTLLLEDLGSSNGTFVNDQKITQATAVKAGDLLRFGNVEALLEDDRPVAREAGPRRKPAQTLVAAAAFLGIVFAAVLIVKPGLLFPSDPDSQPKKESEESPRTAEPGTGKTTDPPVSPPREEPRIPDKPSLTPRTDPSKRDRKKPELAAGQRVLMRDGTVLEGRITSQSAAWIELATEGVKRPRKLATELVREIDGRPVVFARKKALAERLANARDERELLALASWCKRIGLSSEVPPIARRILRMFPNHPEARRLVGEYLYRGSWRSESELAAGGALSVKGDLMGTNADLRRIRRWCFSLLGRPPLPQELADFLALPDGRLRKDLLNRHEAWGWWCHVEAAGLFAPDELVPMERALVEAADRLWKGEDTFTDFFKAMIRPDRFARDAAASADTVARVLHALLGLDAKSDRSLVRAATRMWSGERVAVFGERGENAEDLIEIVTRQPSFLRRRLEILGHLLFGANPERKEVNRYAFTLAAAPAQFSSVREAWAEKALTVGAPGAYRPKTDIQLVNGLYVDALKRRPTSKERAEALQLLTDVGDRDIAQAILAAGIVARGKPPVKPDPGSAEAHVRTVFRWIFARSPRADELTAGERLTMDAGAPASSLIRSLLASGEYRWF